MVNLSNSSLSKWNSHFIIDWLGVGFSRPYMYLKNMDRLFVTTDDWNIFCLTKRSDEIKKTQSEAKYGCGIEILTALDTILSHIILLNMVK